MYLAFIYTYAYNLFREVYVYLFTFTNTKHALSIHINYIMLRSEGYNVSLITRSNNHGIDDHQINTPSSFMERSRMELHSNCCCLCNKIQWTGSVWYLGTLDLIASEKWRFFMAFPRTMYCATDLSTNVVTGVIAQAHGHSQAMAQAEWLRTPRVWTGSITGTTTCQRHPSMRCVFLEMVDPYELRVNA